jgi:outer membrane protein OmpA-like peptidoglycan-associated protein
MSRAAVTLLGSTALVSALAFAVPASAQEQMYPGQDVVVNPNATGGQVLLYPDGTHTRVVPQLRQPGDDGQIIHLHMPVKHRVVHHRPKPQVQVATAEPMPDYSAQTYTPPPAPAPAPKPMPKPVKKAVVQKASPPPAAAPAAPANSGGGLAFTFGGPSNYATPPATAPSGNTKLASNPPPPANTAPSAAAGLTRRSQIIFASGIADPAPNSIDAIRMLGSDLNSAVQGAGGRIQLQAYGGAKGDKSSDARRLSLKRALAIRTILISAGVPSAKIDVRAMGGADDGPLDRVDVYIRS